MSLRAEIEAFYESYAAAFSTYDADGVSAHWSFPAVITGAARSMSFDAAAFAANTAGLFGFYRRQGVEGATAEVLSAEEIFPGFVNARVRYTMLAEGGAQVVSFESVYLLRRAKEGWRAAVGVADDEIAAWAARGTPLGR